jgi:hypothetical protein
MTSHQYKSLKTYVTPSQVNVDVHIDNEEILEEELIEMSQEELISRRLAFMAKL